MSKCWESCGNGKDHSWPQFLSQSFHIWHDDTSRWASEFSLISNCYFSHIFEIVDFVFVFGEASGLIVCPDGSVQDCNNSSALAVELLQSCTKRSISSLILCLFAWNSWHITHVLWKCVICYFYEIQNLIFWQILVQHDYNCHQAGFIITQHWGLTFLVSDWWLCVKVHLQWSASASFTASTF